MKSAHFQDKSLNHHNKRDICLNSGRLASFFFSSLALTMLFSFFLYFPSPFEAISRSEIQRKGVNVIKPPEGNSILHCDLFKGHWTRDHNASLYKNSTCSTIPESKNCFLNGRTDKDFLNWRWKPEGCNLPRFDPKIFLDMVRGNKMAFIGDSVAENQVHSLLCLLSLREIPKDIYKNEIDRNRIWHFSEHDFTLMNLRTNFLVTGEQRSINGSLSATYNLHIDKVDKNWIPNLPTTDYVIISEGHWFFRPIYLYDGGKIIGCVYCNEPNITNVGVGGAIRLTFRAALAHINGCKECRGLVTVVRTFSPAHFENGTWDTGGSCSRTSPLNESDINLESEAWELRKIQIEEAERAQKEGEKHGKTFVIMDVTKAMLMRPDAHPGDYWGNRWMKGYRDCVHWCMPGPIDMWNEFLMAILEIETGLVS